MTKSDKETALPAYENLEDVPLREEEDSSKITWSVVITYLKGVVIEPFFMLFMFCNAGRNVFTLSLLKDKACLNELGHNRTVCDDLHNYPDIENEVQRYANNYHMAFSLLDVLPGVAANIFLSSWSDNYGRKVPLLLATFGVILEFVGIIINLLDFELPIAYLILPAIPGGFCGGVVVILTACVSYISDDSDNATRALRFAFFEFAYILAAPIGGAVCGVLYEKSGYLAVFLTCLGCVVVGFVLLLFRLKEKRKKKLTNFKEAANSLFTLENVKANVKVCIRKRDGTVRKEMWLTFFAMSCSILNVLGTETVNYFFTSKMYNWGNYTYSMWSMVFSVSRGITVLVVVPLVTKFFKASDVTIALIGVISTFVQTVQRAFAYETWLYFIATFTGLLGGLFNIGVRSRLSKLIPKNEAGSAFAVLMLCESVTPVIGLTVFAQIYNASVAWFPGLTNLVAAAFLIFPICIYAWIGRFATPPPYNGNQAKSTDSENSNHVDVMKIGDVTETPSI